jgi:hypothetical protein
MISGMTCLSFPRVSILTRSKDASCWAPHAKPKSTTVVISCICLSYSFSAHLTQPALSILLTFPAIFFNKSHLDRLSLYIYNHSRPRHFFSSFSRSPPSCHHILFLPALSLPLRYTCILLSSTLSRSSSNDLVSFAFSYVFPARSHAYATCP